MGKRAKADDTTDAAPEASPEAGLTEAGAAAEVALGDVSSAESAPVVVPTELETAVTEPLPVVTPKEPELDDGLTNEQRAALLEGSDHVEDLTDVAPPTQETLHERRELTADEVDRMHAASDETLANVLADPRLDPELRDIFLGEVTRRELARLEDDEAARLAQAPVTVYELLEEFTVNHEGMLTQMARGSLISSKTHDVQKLVKQGCKLKPAGSQVSTKYDLFGRPVTVVR